MTSTELFNSTDFSTTMPDLETTTQCSNETFVKVPLTWAKFWDGADFTVYIGFILSVLLFGGLCAYLTFIGRVTLKDRRRRQKMDDVTASIAYESQYDQVTGIANLGFIGKRYSKQYERL